MEIKQILKEEILKETILNDHAIKRMEERFNRMKNENDLTPKEVSIITDNLQKILSHEFNPKVSYGILLGTFKPNPNSRLYTTTNKWHPNVPFYEIYGENLRDIIKDSTGDEFWAVVRENEITTVMLRKNLQREFALNDREDNGGLGVDVVTTNINDFIAKEEAEKQKTLQLQQQQQEKKNNIVIIDAVKWVVDSANNKVYQKNKPERYVSLDNIFDHFDDKTNDEILSKI